MNINDVTEKLKTIGPFVRYDELEMPDDYRVHRWFVGSEPHGPNSCIACLAFPRKADDPLVDFSTLDWESILEEGRRQYATKLMQRQTTQSVTPTQP